MNWDAIGAVAETLGALAVIVSIIYLATQVRQTRLQLQAQAEDTISNIAFDAYSPIYQDGNHAVFRRGLEASEPLSEDEAFLFRMLMDRQRGVFATIVRRAESGVISETMADGFLESYRRMFLHTEGGRAWYAQAREHMSKLEIRLLEQSG